MYLFLRLYIYGINIIYNGQLEREIGKEKQIMDIKLTGILGYTDHSRLS